ncbi:ATP-dependent protease, partial [Peptococcaceae bacterium SCADC1_2_3]
KMSGNIHSKGILTLVGFLGERFAQDKPLRLSARLTFEQLYETIEGDSASSAELYALLSALTELPIEQGLAVTGSVNQHGEIQPIGGVTEKIEGFYAVCKAKGLNGKQGVIIPYQNIDNLMLKHEVVEAVQKNLFHVFAIKTIEEGISLLTGVPALPRPEKGGYPEGTVYYLADKKLRAYAEGLAKFGESKKEATKDEPIDKSEATTL